MTGVGPGTGAAIAQRFATGGYDVAMLARNGERLAALAREIPNTHAYVCDVTDEGQLDATLAAVRATLGDPSILEHNAVGGARGNFLEIDPQVLNRVLVQVGSTDMRVPDVLCNSQAQSTAFQIAGAVPP